MELMDVVCNWGGGGGGGGGGVIAGVFITELVNILSNCK